MILIIDKIVDHFNYITIKFMKYLDTRERGDYLAERI
jgi:hypothetical protein